MFDRKKEDPAAETGSDSGKKKKKKGEEEDRPAMKNMADDTSFQSFVGILKKAVERRDFATISSMMVSGFGYRWDTPPSGDNVFAYWDRNQLWNELALVLNEEFAPKEGFMVAPRAFAEDPINYRGFRAGMALVRGSWKFAYFVGDEPVAPPEAAPQ
jgi:hypothetical protein